MNKTEFVYVTYIKTTPEKLWQALTTSEFTKQYWFDTAVESDWKVGSPIALRPVGTGAVMVGKVLKNNPLKELSYTWDFPQSEKATASPSRVTFSLEKDNDMVKLTVVHDELEAGSEMSKGISRGWPAVLSSLKSLLENGKALAYPNLKGSCG
jgi:uncharacterized protein YndB with AHSA1/START domain